MAGQRNGGGLCGPGLVFKKDPRRPGLLIVKRVKEGSFAEAFSHALVESVVISIDGECAGDDTCFFKYL